jgi:hypothetical protein
VPCGVVMAHYELTVKQPIGKLAFSLDLSESSHDSRYMLPHRTAACLPDARSGLSRSLRSGKW